MSVGLPHSAVGWGRGAMWGGLCGCLSMGFLYGGVSLYGYVWVPMGQCGSE